MTSQCYKSAVKETFETKPLKTVLMIDDQFPTFADLADLVDERGNASEPRFRQKDRALALYRGFQKRHMICDVENNVTGVEAERFRKSDLILLDYNLGPGEHNHERAIDLLRALSVSKHFNTVVVYTDEDDLDTVWLEIIASLSPSWVQPLEGEARTIWDDLNDRDKVPVVSMEAVKQYMCRKDIREIDKAVLDQNRQEVKEAGVDVKYCNDIIEAMIHKELKKIADENPNTQKGTAIGDYSNGVYWVQFRNIFVAIHKKADLTDSSDDPAGIMKCLGDALLSWRPNLIQILVSEIQNILELEALVTEDSILRLPSMHAALLYYLLCGVGDDSPDKNGAFEGPLTNVIDKIVDGIRLRLVSSPKLLDLAENALKDELSDKQLLGDKWPQAFSTTMLNAAIEVSRTKGMTTQPEVIFKLNHFFSTEPVTRSHITTGTVFFCKEQGEYYVIATPACDLEPRPPSTDQKWAHSIHPFTPFTAIHLNLDDKGLTNAANGKHIFLNKPKEQAFRIVNGTSQQPTYEYFFAEDMGRISKRGGKKMFSASRVKKEGQGARATQEFVTTTFEVVAQLRDLNANRILQLVGQHVSRIALDFVSLPNK